MAKPTAKKTSKGKAGIQAARQKKKTPSPKPAPRAARKTPTPSKSAKSPKRSNGVPQQRSAKAAVKIPARSAARSRPIGGAGKPRLSSPKTPPAPIAAAPAPAPTPTRPGKNLAGLKLKDLEFFRGLLLAKRREIVGDMHSMEAEALRSTSGSNLSNLPMHMADMGTDNYEQEFTLGLVEKDRQLLREINLALKKIADGNYGMCEGTGKPIARARLEAKPWARYSIEYTIKLEKGLVRG